MGYDQFAEIGLTDGIISPEVPSNPGQAPAITASTTPTVTGEAVTFTGEAGTVSGQPVFPDVPDIDNSGDNPNIDGSGPISEYTPDSAFGVNPGVTSAPYEPFFPQGEEMVSQKDPASGFYNALVNFFKRIFGRGG